MSSNKPRRLFKKVIAHKKINSNISAMSPYAFAFCVDSPLMLTRSGFEALRIVITRLIRKRRILDLKMGSSKKGKGFFSKKISFTVPLTNKSSKSRMGKGKGSISEYYAKLNIGDCFCVISNIPLYLAKKILYKVSYKLGIPIYMYDSMAVRYSS